MATFDVAVSEQAEAAVYRDFGIGGFSVAAMSESAFSSVLSDIRRLSGAVFTTSIVTTLSTQDLAATADTINTLAVLNPVVNEAAAFTIAREVGGGGFAVGAMSEEPFSGFEVTTIQVSGDQPFANIVTSLSTQDSAGGVDAPLGNVDFATAFTDSASGADTAEYYVAFPVLVSESAEFAVYREIGGGGFSVYSVSEEPFSGFETSVVRISGDHAASLVNVNSASTDTASQADSLFTNANLTFGVQESVAVIADTVRGLATFQTTADESGQAADQNNYFVAFPTAFSDSASGSDVNSASQGFAVSTSDTASGSMQTSSLASFGGVASERAVARDAPSSNFTVNSAFAETARVLDTARANVTVSSLVVELVSAVDETSMRLQWELIDTFEASDWVLINTFTPDD